LALLEAHPETDFEFHAVWVDVLDSDSPAAAASAALFLDDPRVRHFHDRERRFGRLLAPRVGMPAARDLLDDWQSSVDEQDRVFTRDFLTGPATAYDWIAFFGPDARWTSEPELPAPTAAVVQMAPDTWRGIDPARFFWGPGMAAELRRLADLHVAR